MASVDLEEVGDLGCLAAGVKRHNDRVPFHFFRYHLQLQRSLLLWTTIYIKHGT